MKALSQLFERGTGRTTIVNPELRATEGKHCLTGAFKAPGAQAQRSTRRVDSRGTRVGGGRLADGVDPRSRSSIASAAWLPIS